MLGLSLDFWRHLRIALPNDAWREFLRTLRTEAYSLHCGRPEPIDHAEARFAIGAAVCWLAHDYGGSEFCALRCADNLTGYQPSPLERGTSDERDPLAHRLYTLTAEHLAKVTR